MYTQLTKFMSNESIDVGMTCPRGAGLEACRWLAIKYDPATGGRSCDWYCNLDDACSTRSAQRWHAGKNVYDAMKNSRETLERDVCSEATRLALLGSLVLEELERLQQLNASKIHTYAMAREEIRLYIDTRVGAISQASEGR